MSHRLGRHTKRLQLRLRLLALIVVLCHFSFICLDSCHFDRIMISTIHFLLHHGLHILVNELTLAVDRCQVFFRLSKIAQSALTLQIIRADMLAAQLFKHALVEDGFLFFFDDSVLKFELTFVFLHRFSTWFLFYSHIDQSLWSKSLIIHSGKI